MENENQTDLEDVIQEVENETPKVEEVVEEQPELDLSKFDSAEDPSVIKVDLSKPNDETEESNTDDAGVVRVDEDAQPAQSEDEVQPQGEVQEEVPTLEEVTEEQVEEFKEEVADAIEEAQATGGELPENVKKLIDFMADTGGDLEDYVRLNRDVSSIDDQDALREYYRDTKPHLSSEEISFLMEDQFAYDETIDDERDIKRRKLARKEQVAEAKAYLDRQKSKYYEEIKAGSKLTPEQQKAVDFFNRYNKESEQTQKTVEKQKLVFNKKTQQVFNDEFKGFDYNVGDKTYRYSVKDAEQIKNTQSDINNFVGKFLDENNTMSDAKGYHKSLFTAMNADAVARHFYEQGKADALKETVAKSKNINMDPRQSHSVVEAGGIKVRVLGDDSNSFKFKMKSKK
tara:strand:+ start:3973 stop:5172 length:1200 start_codon:yes stop_codon:yes gene_type:complete